MQTSTHGAVRGSEDASHKGFLTRIAESLNATQKVLLAVVGLLMAIAALGGGAVAVRNGWLPFQSDRDQIGAGPTTGAPADGATPSERVGVPPIPIDQIAAPPAGTSSVPLATLPVIVPPPMGQIATQAPTNAPSTTGTIQYPPNSTTDVLSYVNAGEYATGQVSSSNVEGLLFAGVQLVGSIDGRTITPAMKDPVFVYAVTINNRTWESTVFFGKNESAYSGLVFTLYLFEARSDVAQQLRKAPGQAFSLAALEPYVHSLDAHGVVRR